MEYLGTPGRMVQLDCASQESTARPDRYRLQETSTGGVRAQVQPLTPRTWSISTNALDDRDLAALEGFVYGEWGAGPWQWVSIAAQHGNLLTPAESMCLSAGQSWIFRAGPMLGSDGTWSGRSLSHVRSESGWSIFWDQIPALPGKPFTFSADVQGGGQVAPQLTLGFRDAGGTFITVHTSSGTASHAGPQRASVTVTAPIGAASVAVGAQGSVKALTRPQATWLGHGVPWTTGKGCRTAVVMSVDSTLLWSPGTRRQGTLSDSVTTIQELI